MARAGAAAAEWAVRLLPDPSLPVLVLAGPGNNGGDAIDAATRLHGRGRSVALVLCVAPADLPPDAAAAHGRAGAAGLPIVHAIPDAPPSGWGLVIDGIFGIGLTRAPAGVYADWIDAINALSATRPCPVLALDCPSGLDADTGAVLGLAVRATHTLTFIADKPGLHTADGPDHCGVVRVAPLDLPLAALPDADGNRVITRCFAARLTRRPANSHKGSFGSVGIVGGAPGMLGAAFLAGRAALKLGAGRVYLGLLDPNAPAVDPLCAELMLRPHDALPAGVLTALACGPGLGADTVAQSALSAALDAPLPLVLDADALNLLAADVRFPGRLGHRSVPTLLTPHPAEAARLLGSTVGAVQSDRIASAIAIAQRYRSLVALKGCGTVIAVPDGRWWINTTGNPGMATAGSGDVLTGLAAALLAQGWPALEALLAATHLHGAAGDALVDSGVGPVGMCASELIDAARGVFNAWIGGAGRYNRAS